MRLPEWAEVPGEKAKLVAGPRLRWAQIRDTMATAQRAARTLENLHYSLQWYVEVLRAVVRDQDAERAADAGGAMLRGLEDDSPAAD